MKKVLIAAAFAAGSLGALSVAPAYAVQPNSAEQCIPGSGGKVSVCGTDILKLLGLDAGEDRACIEVKWCRI